MNDYTIALETVTRWEQIRRGVALTIDQETARIEFIKAGIVRIKISQAGVLDATPTFAIQQDEFGTPDFSIRQTNRGLLMKSDSLTVRIGMHPFHLDITRADGSTVFKSVKGETYRFLNNRWRVRRKKSARDTILGLGEKTLPFNHNGRKLSMWNVDVLGPDSDGAVRQQEDPDSVHNPMGTSFDPYYVSINLHYHLPHQAPHLAAASYMDCGYRLNYDFSNAAYYEIEGEGGQLTEYVFAGPSLREIVQDYTALTGRMQAPPLWALGHHQCRWHDYTSDDVKQLARQYRRKKLPCDTVWLDIDYMDGYRVFTWNKERFPDPAGLIEHLRTQGFRVITIIDPGVKIESGYPVFDEGQERNLFCKTESGQLYVGQVWPGRTAFPDFVKESARQWWGRLNAEHVQSGLAGIWNDMNEPSTGEIPPGAMRFDRDGADYPHERYRNQYALLMAMGTVAGLRETMPDLRTFVLSRAGFAGIQRVAANWTGDNTSTWEHLAMSLPMNANLGLSGQPFVGSDIGGFCFDSDGELLVRWYQYGAFQPFMRNHNCRGSRDQYPWSFGSRCETAIRKAIELRYRLMPTIYTSFMSAAETGAPIQRPLAFEWQDDPIALANDTEFCFGDHLLVAPVLVKGATRRRLYLPKGDWYCFYTGLPFTGGQHIEVEAPLDHLPVFVRAGAVIPMVKPMQSTAQWRPDMIELHVYAPARNGVTTSFLHEDDGITDAYRRGAYRRTCFTVERRGKQLRVSASGKGDGFPESVRKRFRLIVHGADLPACTIANRGAAFTREFALSET